MCDSPVDYQINYWVINQIDSWVIHHMNYWCINQSNCGVISWTFPLSPSAQFCLAGFIILAFSDWWVLAVLYAGWLWLDLDTPVSGGRRSQWTRNWRIWHHFRDYFPLSVTTIAHFSLCLCLRLFGFIFHQFVKSNLFVQSCLSFCLSGLSCLSFFLSGLSLFVCISLSLQLSDFLCNSFFCPCVCPSLPVHL